MRQVFCSKKRNHQDFFPHDALSNYFLQRCIVSFFFRKEAPSGFFLIPTCCLLHVGASQKRLIILALNHYGNDTVLLFPQLPFLLCLLFFDALSHHVYVILFVSVKPEAERQQRRATRWHHTTRRQRKTNRPDDDSDCERPSQLSTSILPTHTKKPLHCRVHVPVEAVRVAD